MKVNLKDVAAHLANIGMDEYAEAVNDAADYIKKLEKGFEIYERERNRFKHTYPEISGSFFLTGGHGDTDDNMLPEFVRICPAYGSSLEQVYKRTDSIISSEGS